MADDVAPGPGAPAASKGGDSASRNAAVAGATGYTDGSGLGPGVATHGSGFFGLALGSVGVVFGDIGTSPLYAMREALAHSRGGGTAEAVLGVVSLVFWALLLIVTLKYVVFLMRADNKGEGGTLALMALAQRALGGQRPVAVFFLGVVGAALFYGDGIITPAVSVVGALEGLGGPAWAAISRPSSCLRRPRS